MLILNLLAIVVASYLMGSIPTAIWTGKLVYGVDVREHGSGNAGATNVFRVLGWRPALFVMVVDVAKGAIPTLLCVRFWVAGDLDLPVLQIIAGLSAVLGHVWTIFARFRGGKGVGTLGGMLIALFPLALPLCLLVFALVVWKTRYVSLSSMSAVICLPFSLLGLTYFFDQSVPSALWVFSFLMIPFVLFTHRSNIGRLLAGTEKRFGDSAVPPKEP